MNAETADENNPTEQSQAELAEVTKPEGVPIGDDGLQNKSCSPLDLDQNPVNGSEKHSNTIDNTLHSHQVLEKGSENEAAAAGEQMEKEDSKTNIVDEKLASSGGQNNIHSSVMEKTLENITMETLVCDTNPCISTEGVKKVSPHQLDVKSSENKSANSIAEDQNLIKRTLPESETKQTFKNKVEKEAMQQRSDSYTKVESMIKLNLYLIM